MVANTVRAFRNGFRITFAPRLGNMAAVLNGDTLVIKSGFSADEEGDICLLIMAILRAQSAQR